jgi:phospholipid/cholesterol/gamma-HCH transport system substrate-binding protein
VRKETVGRRRWAAGATGAAGVVALVLVVLLASSAGGSNGGYTVRAIFDDAGNIISGEDVKIDGVKVGAVGSVTPTAQAKAAVVLHIENTGFQDFRSDASCTVRPQALIGEKFVDCLPTQSRVEGTPLPPALKKIGKGQEGEGEYLLPVQNTHSPVDVDLLGDISRLPERERLTIIINELGAGLAGRGSDLSAVVRRANPALQELDRVLAVLAGENRVLAKLAVDSDKALAPFAKVRTEVADFLEQSNKVSQASAAHRGAIAQSLKDFPPLLKQLGPAMERLGRFADQATPVFTNLKVAAPAIDKTFTSLPGFSNSSSTFFENLGKTSKVTGPAVVATKPLLARLKALGGAAQPASSNLAELLGSLQKTGGLERLLDFIFLGAGAGNGYDSLGHFLRAEAVASTCLKYATKRVPFGCVRQIFSRGSTATASAAKASSTGAESVGVMMERTLAVMKGASPADAIAKYPGATPSPRELVSAPTSTTGTTGLTPTAQPVGGTTGATTYYSPEAEASGAGGLLLNYLLGN